MKRLLLVVALLVAGVAPAWAQSDNRWIAVFHLDGYKGKGYSRSIGGGDRTVAWMAQSHHIMRTMFDRMAVPVKEFSLPDSGAWAGIIGTARNAGEADSVWFRRTGCMGWIMTMDLYSSSFDGSPYSGETTAYFTGTGSTKGTFACSPQSGLWGIPGVTFTVYAQSNSGQGFFNGISGTLTKASTARVRQAFTNGDSISIKTETAFVISPAESANVTKIIYSDTLDGTGSSVIAWRYKTNALWYAASNTPYEHSTPYLLAVANIFTMTGYSPKRKLNLHADLDHPYPDATRNRVPTDSLLAYLDARQWRHGGAIEANSDEVADDWSTTRALVNVRRSQIPSHPHSHNYLNFGDNTKWNLTTFADTSTQRQRWNYMKVAVRDTIGSKLGTGYEYVGTFPNNDAYFPSLYIMAADGIRDIRTIPADSVGAMLTQNPRKWQKVPSPRPYVVGTENRYGLPYMYLEPKTNKRLYVHDGRENPVSGDTLYLGASDTDHTQDMEGFAARNMHVVSQMAIWDGGWYWHPDLNLTTGRFMADFYRRLTYFYGRVSNILTVQPYYLPQTPRKIGSTARTYP